ncbi:hypothetical protein LCGC14_2239440 [marine sediment metagenome]|uniref:Uncharacterized protein n=1 Tax=marine sediment metagenome TaxID=412755 RepID=A0A0F9D624_9ZZZZ
MRKTSISAIKNHPSNVLLVSRGSILTQNKAVLSSNRTIAKTIVRNDKVTINLLGGVQTMYISLFFVLKIS